MLSAPETVLFAMTANFSEKQVGKRVVDQKGVEVGTVRNVRNGEIYVEVGTDADPDTLDDLRWDGTVNQEAHELRQEHIGDIGEDVIRLSV